MPKRSLLRSSQLNSNEKKTGCLQVVIETNSRELREVYNFGRKKRARNLHAQLESHVGTTDGHIQSGRVEPGACVTASSEVNFDIVYIALSGMFSTSLMIHVDPLKLGDPLLILVNLPSKRNGISLLCSYGLPKR